MEDCAEFPRRRLGAGAQVVVSSIPESARKIPVRRRQAAPPVEPSLRSRASLSVQRSQRGKCTDHARSLHARSSGHATASWRKSRRPTIVYSRCPAPRARRARRPAIVDTASGEAAHVFLADGFAARIVPQWRRPRRSRGPGAKVVLVAFLVTYRRPGRAGNGHQLRGRPAETVDPMGGRRARAGRGTPDLVRESINLRHRQGTPAPRRQSRYCGSPGCSSARLGNHHAIR